MNRRFRTASPKVIVLFALVVAGCAALSGVGDLTPERDSGVPVPEGGTALDVDGSTSPRADAGDARAPVGTSADAGDAQIDSTGGPLLGDAGIGDAAQGRPGKDLVSGSVVAKSSRYTLILSTGESPGGATVARSPKYTLIAGIIGTTQ